MSTQPSAMADELLVWSQAATSWRAPATLAGRHAPGPYGVTVEGVVQSALAREIQQTREFVSPSVEAGASLIRTTELFSRRLSAVLRAHGLTLAQHNVLMILRGAGEAGLTWSEVGERMLSREPDITRMLDKLQESGLVLRQRSAPDRRVVRSSISPCGLETLAQLEPALIEIFGGTLGQVPTERLTLLIDLLAEIRVHLSADPVLE